MTMPREELEAKVRALSPWFHNLQLDGLSTAPEHFLGDYPGMVWRAIAPSLPENLGGKAVLDIGCNAGYMSFATKRLGAGYVLGIDSNLGAGTSFVEQAEFCRGALGLGHSTSAKST